MFVHTVEVTFKRSRQPADYETAAAEISLKATLAEGEAYVAVVHELLDQAAIAAYTRLAMPNLAKPVFTAIDTGLKDSVTVRLPIGQPQLKAGATAEQVSAAVAAAEPKKGSGRPKKTAEAPTPAAVTNISTAPEDRKEPTPKAVADADISEDIPEDTKPSKPAEIKASSADIPEDTVTVVQAPASAPAGISDKELSDFIMHVVDKPLKAKEIKEIFMQVAGVMQMKDMKTNEIRAKVKAAVENAIAAANEAKSL